MKLEETRQHLIDGTIRVIAEYGLDKASAKRIEAETGINVVYIYRCFEDMEDMFANVFTALDLELFDKVSDTFSILQVEGVEPRERMRLMFTSVWRFLLTNSSKTITYIRYYHSPAFIRYCLNDHHKRFGMISERFAPAFKEEAHVHSILHHVLDVMFNFAEHVFHGMEPDDEATEEHVFRVVWESVKQYFREEQE